MTVAWEAVAAAWLCIVLVAAIAAEYFLSDDSDFWD